MASTTFLLFALFHHMTYKAASVTIEENLCKDLVFDAATIDGQNFRLFKGGHSWELKKPRERWYIDPVKATSANTIYTDFPGDVDAAFTWKMGFKDRTIFLKGRMAYSYIRNRPPYYGYRKEEEPRNISGWFEDRGVLGPIQAAISQVEENGRMVKVWIIFRGYYFFLDMIGYPHQVLVIEHGQSTLDVLSFFNGNFGRSKRQTGLTDRLTIYDITAAEFWMEEAPDRFTPPSPTAVIYFRKNEYMAFPNQTSFQMTSDLLLNMCEPEPEGATVGVVSLIIVLYDLTLVILSTYFVLLQAYSKRRAASGNVRNVKSLMKLRGTDSTVTIDSIDIFTQDSGRPTPKGPKEAKDVPKALVALATPSLMSSKHEQVESIESMAVDGKAPSVKAGDVLFHRSVPKSTVSGGSGGGQTLSMLVQKLKASKSPPPSQSSWYVQKAPVNTKRRPSLF